MSGTDSREDETLTAFLDGELEPDGYRAVLDRLAADGALRARLERLQSAGHGMPDAMQRLLDQAPRAALDSMLDRALAAAPQPKPAMPIRRPFWHGWRLAPMRAVAAMLAVAIVAGAAGYQIAGSARKPAEGWQEAVAEYWTLTTEATLALAPSADLTDNQLDLAGRALGISLTAAGISLDGPSFRGAQLYAFNDKPLVQIAYLDPDYGPIAYCVIRNGKPDETVPAAKTIDGFEVVHWQGGGYGRMVIGRAPAERLHHYAEQLAAEAGQGA